jgi:hypothetical protein
MHRHLVTTEWDSAANAPGTGSVYFQLRNIVGHPIPEVMRDRASQGARPGARSGRALAAGLTEAQRT